MDRRTFLQGSLGATVAAMTAQAAAQAAGSPSPATLGDTREVWLTGDTAPTDPGAMAARLAGLAQEGGADAIDRYLVAGEVDALERAFAEVLGKDDCAFLPTGTLANNIAVRVLCGEHRRALVQRESHLYRDEVDAAQDTPGPSVAAP